MTISSISELKKLIAMLQKEGVEICKVDGIELVLRPLPEKQDKRAKSPAKSIIDNFGEVDENTRIPAPKIDMPDELTEDQLLNWSVGPSIPTPGNG